MSPLHAWFRFPIDLHHWICTIVFTFIFTGKSSNPMFFICNKSPLVPITIGVDIFAISLALAIDIWSEVLVVVGINCVSLACIIAWWIAGFSTNGCELIGSSSLFLCHLSFNIIIIWIHWKVTFQCSLTHKSWWTKQQINRTNTFIFINKVTLEEKCKV